MSSNFEEQIKDPGGFEYDDSGFSLLLNNKREHIKWQEIQTAFGFKRDYYTTDCICLDVFCDRRISFGITEEVTGWYPFLEKMAIAFPNTAGWEHKIATPSFETMLRVVYDREGRDLETVQALYYKE